MRKVWLGALALLLGGTVTCGQNEAQRSAWSALSAPAMDPSKLAVTENVDFALDRVHIKLVNGTIQFGAPTNGVVFTAVFHGQGQVRVDPPNAIEAQQLKVFTKQKKIAAAFTDATFSFTDDLMEEVGRQVKWKGGGGASDELYANRQKFREDLGQSAIPRLLQGVLATDRKRNAYFLADLKSEGKQWVEFIDDALEPEKISLGQWVNVGPMQIFDLWMSFPAGKSSAEAWKDPRAKEDFSIKKYNIDATVTSGAELIATAKVELEPRIDGQGVLVFELDSNLRVDSVKEGRGRGLPFHQARETKDRYQSYGDYVAVTLTEPLKTGSAQTLEFHYGGEAGDPQSRKWKLFLRKLGMVSRAAE